jgi:molybdopterin-guanine dinucleotide biosynthesis protein A
MENLWNDFNTYLQTGFAHVNVVQGLLIAIVAAFMTYRWSSVFIVAIGAAVVHVLVDALLPVLNKAGDFHLPPVVDKEYWHYLLALYLGYIVAITMFYVVKRVLISARQATA